MKRDNFDIVLIMEKLIVFLKLLSFVFLNSKFL